MSADIVSHHGGDGGGQDPTDPSRIPSTCESDRPARRRGRGPASNVNIEKRRRDAGKPLELELDPATDKVVGTEHQAFVRQLSTEVTLLLPGHYLDFKDVPQQYKDQVVQKMKESWKEIVDLFLSPKFVARSTQNKKNRKEMKYLSTQGSKSMAAIRNEYDEPDDHAIDAWRDTHIKKSTKTWVSETCKELHEQMAQEMERQNIQSSRSGSESASSEGSTAKSIQYQVMDKVLGSRSDYQIGVGYRPRGKGKKSTSSSTSQSSSQTQSQVPTNVTPEMMGVLAEMWVKMRDKVESGNLQNDSSLHDPRYESLLQQFLPSQQQGSTSNQSPGTSSMPQQPQQNSPNISGGSSQSPLFNYMFGLSSQFPQTQLMGSQFGGLPQQQQQQQQPMYGQFGSFMQQQPVYPHYGGSTHQPVYNQQYYTSPNQQQQQSPLIRPQPRPYYPSPPAPQSHEGSLQFFRQHVKDNNC
ncbi:altered inheritance of mitochondria protein 3-like [Humulus lupulus]|uniref:altered inheritance of mitochondria protein 3-like n=1 Tax=Humulus lupulus TaxID=3486 RepID=UPI002B40B2E6|nr:altered inheritance of mitochondria protein 3-like [Humulus lupulus]